MNDDDIDIDTENEPTEDDWEWWAEEKMREHEDWFRGDR